MSAILLLAGTAEARELSHMLGAAPGMRLITSLAGVTRDPAEYGGTMRIGGFSGAAGLASFLRDEGIVAVIDATHPFATTMSANAGTACATTRTPLLRLERPEWRPMPGDDWTVVPDLPTAVAMLPTGAVALVATGASAGPKIPPRDDISLILRSIEVPAQPLPETITLIRARPPFSEAQEMALFRAQGVSHLICKNAGGAQGRSKLVAANRLHIAVLMIPRPAHAPVDARVETPAEAAAWAWWRVANGTGTSASRA